VLSSKINHPRLAQPKPALERFERVWNNLDMGGPVKYPFISSILTMAIGVE
jgi:hypothetical protein